jgi:hypothetical protein
MKRPPGPRHFLFSRISALMVLLIGLSRDPAFAAEIAWMRLLLPDSAPLTWRVGQAAPARPEGFPLEPSAVFSYTALRPGLNLDDPELDVRARRFQRTLEECGRFTRAAVYVVQAGPEGESRGVVAEVEPRGVPGFSGGAVYAGLELPLVGGRRAALNINAGANQNGVSYRDDALFGLPAVFDASLMYANNLMESEPLSIHRLEARIGAGPRLGPLGSLTAGTRAVLYTRNGAPETPLLALDAAFSGTLLGIGRPILDSSWKASASYYPQSGAVKASALGSFRAKSAPGSGPGTIGITLTGGAGWSSGGLEDCELFDLGQGALAIRGPDGEAARAERFVLGGAEADFQAIRVVSSGILRIDAGPFAFAEAARTESLGSRAVLFGAGGGIRLYFNPPVSVRMDLGFAAGLDGSGAFLFSVTSKALL